MCIRDSINTTGVVFLRLLGLQGDDIFNIPGNQPIPVGVNVQGGNPSASDVLNFTGTGGAVTLDLVAQTVTETGFGPVSFSGVETLNVNAGAGAISVVGTSGPDDLSVTPTGATTSTVVPAGLNLSINTTTAALNICLLYTSPSPRD